MLVVWYKRWGMCSVYFGGEHFGGCRVKCPYSMRKFVLDGLKGSMYSRQSVV